MFSYGAWRGPEPGGVENPFLFTLSPLHRHAPGFTDGITFTLADLRASISLAAAVGAVRVSRSGSFIRAPRVNRQWAGSAIRRPSFPGRAQVTALRGSVLPLADC